MSNITIKEILQLPDNTALESIQGLVTEVYKIREVKGGKTVQDAKLRDGSGAEIKLSVWDHQDISTYKGKEVIISSGPKGGLKVQLDTYRQPHVNTISVSRTGTFQYLQVHQAQTGAPVSANQPVSAPVAQVSSGGPVGGHGSGPVVVNGAKIGMVLNNACLFLTSAGEPFNVDRVHEIASELLKLSTKLENGELYVKKEESPY